MANEQRQFLRVDSHNDHRLAMASAVLALKMPGIELKRSEAVSKTCPDFWQRWEALLGVLISDKPQVQ